MRLIRLAIVCLALAACRRTALESAPGPTGDAGVTPGGQVDSGPPPGNPWDAAVDSGPADGGEGVVPASCEGAAGSDATGLMLLARSETAIVGFSGAGRRLTIDTLPADAQGPSGSFSFHSQVGYGHVAIAEYAQASSGVSRILRLDLRGNVELAVDIPEPRTNYRSQFWFGVQPDGSIVHSGQYGSQLTVLPDGTLERREGTAPVTSGATRTPEGYYIEQDADVAGWKIVAVPSNVVPLPLAFYETATKTLRRARYASTWIVDAASQGRLVYVGQGPDGVSIVDEGVSDERFTVVQGKPTDLIIQPQYGSDPIRINRGGVLIGWLDGASRNVTFRTEAIALFDAGGWAVTAGRWQLLAVKNVPLRALDSGADGPPVDVDLGSLDLPSAKSWSPYQGMAAPQDLTLFSGDGVPTFVIERAPDAGAAGTPVYRGRRLDRNAVLGPSATTAQKTETMIAAGFALAVADGIPRSRVSLTTGEILPLDLARDPSPNSGSTSLIGDRALVVVDGWPAWILNVASGDVTALPVPAAAGTIDQVLVTPPWALGVRGDDPLWRVDVGVGTVSPFVAATPPGPDPLYSSKWSTGISTDRSVISPWLTAEGNILAARRDAWSARMYVRSPEQTWAPVGTAVRDVTWLRPEEHAHAYIVRSGRATPCYCSWPMVSWSPAPDDAPPTVTEALQIVPRGPAAPLVLDPLTNLAFDASDRCVLLTPPPGSAPFVYDLVGGRSLDLGSLSAISWVATRPAN
jgi:hypothetical protein